MVDRAYLTRLLPVVADSWDRLRGCDVYRFLDLVVYEERAAGLRKAAELIIEIRPDLRTRVEEAEQDLREEYGWQ